MAYDGLAGMAGKVEAIHSGGEFPGIQFCFELLAGNECAVAGPADRAQIPLNFILVKLQGVGTIPGQYCGGGRFLAVC